MQKNKRCETKKKFTGSYTEVNPGNRQIRRLTLLHEKLLQFNWLRAACENYKPFAGSSINK